jgi:hypothetical protein
MFFPVIATFLVIARSASDEAIHLFQHCDFPLHCHLPRHCDFSRHCEKRQRRSNPSLPTWRLSPSLREASAPKQSISSNMATFPFIATFLVIATFPVIARSASAEAIQLFPVPSLPPSSSLREAQAPKQSSSFPSRHCHLPRHCEKRKRRSNPSLLSLREALAPKQSSSFLRLALMSRIT